MADEAVKVEGTGWAHNMRRFTVANSPAIPIHTLMYISGDNTASFGGTASGAEFAGITTSEKEGGDGQTELTLEIGGVWDLTASGAIPRGHKVVLAGGNRVMDIDFGRTVSVSGGLTYVASSGAMVVGTVTETASDGEVVRVDLSRR